LNVTAKALDRAISEFEEPLLRIAFDRLVEGRLEQVERGVPLTALPILARADDLCVRAVALQAERIDLAPGDFWQPLPTNDPCGDHLGVVVKGRVDLETTAEGRLVVALCPGSLLPEGLAAEYNTRARAVTHVEAYRIRQSDFLVAFHSCPSAQDWFYRFRLLERQTCDHISNRLASTKGVTSALIPHPCDYDIFNLKSRRQKAIENARRLRVEHAEAVKKLPLMAHGSPSDFLRSKEARSSRIFRDEYRPVSTNSVGSVMSRVCSAPSLHGDDRPLFFHSHGDAAHDSSALRLPRLTTTG
jgi:CRP-like cAMP-binding protein